MNCQFADGKRCLVAERIANAPVTTRTDQACEHCLDSPSPRDKNMVTLSLAISSLHRSGNTEAAQKLFADSRPWRDANVDKPRPTLVKRVLSWRASIKRWEEEGKPVRSDEEVERIMRECCEPCEHYNPTWSQCKLCGCFCRKRGQAKFNKPKMATEQCPLEPPKWGGETPLVLPTMVVVAGPHRTGSSCVAGILHALGVSMGTSFIPTTWHNPKGYYEDTALEQFMRTRSGRATDEQKAIWLRDWANTRQEARVVGCKHPLLCTMLPQMATVWPSLHVIAMSRPLSESYASLDRVGWSSLNSYKQLQRLYIRRDEDIAKGKLSVLRIEYRHVIHQPASTVEEIVRFLGLTPTQEQKKAAIDHIDPTLSHFNGLANDDAFIPSHYKKRPRILRPRVFTFWSGDMPPIIKLCLETMRRNIPDVEIWTMNQWKAVYDNTFGPWNRIVRQPPNAQSDVLRYWLLNTYGGIWLDADYIAFRDIRGVWNPDADWIGYLEYPNGPMPFTAMMGGHPDSPIMHKQRELTQNAIKNRRVFRGIGPVLTKMAIESCPEAKTVVIPQKYIHPIEWRLRGGARPDHVDPDMAFDPDAYGCMLLGWIIKMYGNLTEHELMSNHSVIGHAFRKAL